MKPCIWCGFTFEHSEATCKALVAEKNPPRIHIGKGSRSNPGAGRIRISRENILKLERYLKGK